MDLGRYLVERHLREGTPIAELAAAHGVHRVAQVAQPLHVPTQGPVADLEALGQLAPRPVAVRLEQGQQLEHARAGAHMGQARSHSGRKLT